MPFVTLPNTLADGTTAHGPEVRANDDAIVAVVNGQLDDVNVSSGAAIQGTKIATGTLPGDRIKNNEVDKDKLKSDSGPGSPNAAVNTANHIKDGIIPKGKMLAGDLTKAQMNLLVDPKAFSIALAAGMAVYDATVHRVTVGANFEAVVVGLGYSAGDPTSATVRVRTGAVVPNTAIPTATRDLIAVFVADVSYSAPNLTGTVVFVSLAKS